MTTRDDLRDKKVTELKDLVVRELKEYSVYFDNDTDVIVDELFSSEAIRMSSPTEPETVIHMMTFDSIGKNFNGGSSIKPGNIKINLKKLIRDIPEIALLGPTVVSDALVFKVMAAIVIWRTLRNAMTIKIEKADAATIIALWSKSNEANKIEIELGYNTVLQVYKQVDLDEISWERYIKILGELEKKEYIKIEETSIWLREWVSSNYL